MNRRQKLLGLMGTALICAIMAGAAVSAITTAIGLGACALQSWLCALAAALVCAAFGWSAPVGIISAALATVAAGAAVAMGVSGGLMAELRAGIAAVGETGEITALLPAAPYMAGALSAIMALVFYALVSDRSGITTAFAVAICLAASVIPGAMTGSVNAFALAPALAASCAAIAHTSEQRRTGGHLLAFIPAVIAVTLAFLLAPAEGAAWGPLERAADRVRALYEDYFNYTQERVAFSISEKGYDYYGLRNDEPTHMLGGPADPDTGAVMLVETDDDLLLRGSVRGTYTGYSWEDTTPKARNLYYDFTRRARRRETFGADIMEKLNRKSAFKEVEAKVTLLSGGSSTLFVPARLADFHMDLINAVYYNSVGEMFLAGAVEKGDSYSFAAWEAADYSALGEIGRVEDDDAYNAAAREYLSLPDTIEQGVYRVAEALTRGANTDVEKAQAILDGLAANCKYELDVDYPPADRDFVSYFLLDSQEGYCSYFATAMAVLCRIEGIPARYVEGYRVYAEADGVTTVTGEEAHAWTEVYLDGIGWVAYDPTPGENENENSGSSDPAAPENQDTEPTPEITPEPTLPPDADASDENTPEPTSDISDQPTQEPTARPEPTPDSTSEPEPPVQERRRVAPWLWVLLVMLALAAVAFAAWQWFKRRLRKTDPIRLAASQESDDMAILVLYRAMLTLLMHLGQAPLRGETPESFARRLSQNGLDNPDFVEFARLVTIVRYSGTPATRELTALGNRAYMRFRKQMKKGERMKFDIARAFRGLGDFDVIP
jgi:transglutaminase-like putative cysteine protease